MRARLALCVVLVAACSKQRTGGLEATVQLTPGFTSRCLQVAVKYGASSEVRSTAVAIVGKTEVVIGVGQDGLPADVTLYAEGFSDDGCTTLSNPPERSKDVAATFLPGDVGAVTLVLPAAGPTRETACADGLDSDGDGSTDCADADCDGLPCLAGGQCEALSCRAASTERNLCSDGADNDGDGASDCQDSDCLGALCRSTNLCLSGTTCDAAKACSGGSAKVCAADAGACFAAIGACSPGTGQCVYAPLDAGSSCDDGNLCTSPDGCDGAGACVPGATVTCGSPPSACFTSAGATCHPALGCVYPVTFMASCDDGVACTTQDSCRFDGGCAGAAVACAPSECQSFAGSCGADGGCVFTNRAPGSACDAGVCNAGGGCIPTFPYPPANFVESQVPTPPASEVLLDCGVSVIDTGVSGTPTFMSWCGEELPGFATVAQPGGPDAVLLSFTRLTVAAGSTLRVIGARPAIIVGTRDVTLAGVVEAAAGASECADGGVGDRGEEGLTNGGGGGGSFATAGGRGGTGAATFGTSGGGGDPGVVNGSPALVPLRGGCPGALGARSGAPRRAAGGGALQISVAGAIVVSGVVTAPGQGGPAANNGTGGNAAGSGGAIALEALQLTMSAPAGLTAHGGGGGEGGGPLIGGDPGDPGTSDGGAAAGGTNAGQTGGPGGRGSTQAQAAGNGQDGVLGSGNGGGGGGGLGRIRLRASVSCSIGPGVLVSPVAPADGGC